MRLSLFCSSVGKRLSARATPSRQRREQRPDPLRPPRTRTRVPPASSSRWGIGKRVSKERRKQPLRVAAPAPSSRRGSHQAYAWHRQAPKPQAQVRGVQGTRAALSPQPRPHKSLATREDDTHGPSRGLDQWSVVSGASEREWALQASGEPHVRMHMYKHAAADPAHGRMGFGSAHSFTAHVADMQGGSGASGVAATSGHADMHTASASGSGAPLRLLNY